MSTCTSIKKNRNCWIDKRMLTSFYLQDKFICMLALIKRIQTLFVCQKRAIWIAYLVYVLQWNNHLKKMQVLEKVLNDIT
jgi:hypothetical protein